MAVYAFWSLQGSHSPRLSPLLDVNLLCRSGHGMQRRETPSKRLRIGLG